ncbi:MAG: hypothetical protein JOZ47_11650 [Kutzneria sp.]|nr:hypothetical protein [Kutzneria sp.]MBV9845715.1 hypothetical protein [Kutzneria sp.]
MTMRILGIELRRSISLPTGALITAVTVGLLVFFSNAPWNKGLTEWSQQWTSLALWQRGDILQLAIPLAVGMSALRGLRDRRSRTTELLTTTSRPAWQRVLPGVGAMAIGLAGSTLLFYAIGAVQVAGNASYFHLHWVPTALVGILALVSVGWLGMGIGHVFPSRLTPPVLAVAGIVALTTLATGSVLNKGVPTAVTLLSPILDRVWDVCSTVSTSVNIGQAVWFAGLAATGFTLLAVRRPLTRLAAVVPALCAALVALSLLPSTPAEVFAKDQDAAALVCATGTPRVCVTRAHQDKLAKLVGPARQALVALTKLPNPPTSVVENGSSISAEPQPADTVTINLGDPDFGYGYSDAVDTWSADKLELAILSGAGTRACENWQRYSNDPDDYHTNYDNKIREETARVVAATWLLDKQEIQYSSVSRQERPEIDALAVPALATIRGLPADEQRVRMAALRTASLACKGDLLDILTKGTTG